MSLNKKTMVREIGRRTRLSNRDVERVIETLVDVWTEELVNGGRIELENFFVLETIEVARECEHVKFQTQSRYRVKFRVGRRFWKKLNDGM